MKTGLIVEGGGMKCAYSAGVLDVFLDEGISFDYCVGVSAGAANAASFLAGQRDRNKRFYCEHSQRPEYFGMRSFLKTGNLFGLDYIYGTLSEEGGGDPLDYEAMMENNTEFEFPATDTETGKPRYFNKQDLAPDNYSPIKATCALPVATKAVEIDHHFYYDGGVSDSIPVWRSLEKGCDKIVVIMSKPKGFLMEPQGYRRVYSRVLRNSPNIIKDLNHRHEVYNAQLKQVLKMEQEGKAVVYYTPKIEKMSTYSVDSAIAEMLYDSGIYDAKESMDGLKEFLKK
ncbi:MAG: patatin family protein [Lachnospiraceae bacterium]|nr:patatin family protein [Lachnospiraceae bacterium]